MSFSADGSVPTDHCRPTGIKREEELEEEEEAGNERGRKRERIF